MTGVQKRIVGLGVIFVLIICSSLYLIRSEISELQERIPKMADSLYSENDISVFKIADKNILIVGKKFVLKSFGDIKESDLGKVRIAITDIPETFGVYKETKRSLTFILPEKFSGDVVIFINDDDGDKGSKEIKNIRV